MLPNTNFQEVKLNLKKMNFSTLPPILTNKLNIYIWNVYDSINIIQTTTLEKA